MKPAAVVHRWRVSAAAACGLLALSGAASALGSAPEALLSVTLRPVVRDGATLAVGVEETLEGVVADSSVALLELPVVIYNVPTAGALLPALPARDERGELLLTSRDEGSGSATVRRWYPDRATSGTIRIHYEVAPASAAQRGAAPPIELRSEAGAISGGAATFVLRPPTRALRLRVTWDLGALARGATAEDSFAGATVNSDTGDRLDTEFVMAGDLRRYPAARNAAGFQSVWQGDPPFDAPELMRWTEQLHGFYLRFFGVSPAPYTVFMRSNPVNAGGGIGMDRSFVATFGVGRGADIGDFRMTLAHEMFHTFQPHLSSVEGPESLATSWFNEGTAVYYQRVLPLRAGLIDANAYLADLNVHAARYYTSALGNVPNSEIPARFWEDTRIRTLPYDRGFLYFATVDESVRRASHGRRSLDDLLLAMKAREAAGQPVTEATWASIVEADLGKAGVEDLRRVLAGGTPLPGSGAFGPCFRRVSRPLRRYQLGFEPKVLTESPRTVRGLIAGSAAEKAGLRNGDEILRPVPQDDLQGRQDGILTLAIRRTGSPDFDIAYLPRAEPVPAWQWQRVPGVPESKCAR